MKLVTSAANPRDPGAMPVGEYTNVWFDPHAPFWAALDEWALEQRREHGALQWLEIGVYEGRSAAWLLGNLVDLYDSMVLVDPWGPGPEWQPIYERAMRNLDAKHVLGEGRLRPVRRMTSLEFWGRNADPVDFVYVDGAHRAADVAEDVCCAWRRLRLGGIILADDFYNPHTPGAERAEVEAGLRGVHRTFGWPWPPPRFGIDVIYQKVE